MLPETPFLQLLPARAKTALKRIRKEVWSSPEKLSVEFAGSTREHQSLSEAKKRKRKPVSKPFFWGQLEDQAWFRIEIPAACRDGETYLRWMEQGETTAYVNGVPYAGLDIGHLTCLIPKGCREIWMEVMALETGIWVPTRTGRPAITPEGCRFESASAVRRNDLAWDVWHDMEVLLDLLQNEYNHENPSLRSPFGAAIGHATPLEDVSVLYRRLARRIEEAICAYETGGLEAARSTLKKSYAELKGRDANLRCRLTGHAHIDLVWLWTEKASQSKAVHTFATANYLMDHYPEFRFGYSQPASYRAVEQRSPHLMKAVRQRIAQKRWEAVGAAEVESDTMMACGEALARSLLLGQDGFRDLQGKPSPVLWLPDVFGYSACLPQIMAQTGVKYFFTTKLHWGSVTLFPYSSFIWQGSDGTEILSHVSQGMGYNMNVLPGEIRRAAKDYRQSDVHDEMLMACGYGDGGGGVTAEMCERARRLGDLAGTPQSAWGRIDDYFAGLEKIRDRLPAYQGELYLQYHRGVLTTHGDLKAAFRAAERGLQIWEAAHALLGLGDVDVEAWRRAVFAQFHDYIPGSSIREVYEEALPELRAIAQRGHDEATSALAKSGRKDCLFNPLPLKRLVAVGDRLVNIGPLAVEALDNLPTVETAPVQAARNKLSNERVEARFDAKGRITSLKVDGEAVAQSAPLGQLMLYPDHPHMFEAWDIDRSTLALGEAAPAARFDEFSTDGARGQITFSVALTEKSTAKIIYTLEAGSSVLGIEYQIDWQDPHHLLKVLFPTDYNGARARFGDPFGSSTRSQQAGKAYDEAQWEVAGNRYAIVSDDAQQDGLFAVTEAKYGWSCRAGTLGLSLLRSATMPGSETRSGAGEGDALPTCSDLISHRIRVWVGRFQPMATREDLPATLAETLTTPCLETRSGASLSAGLLSIDGGDTLVPCWSKPEAKRNWTLRLHETLGRRGEALVTLAEGCRLRRTDLSGAKVDPQPAAVGKAAESNTYRLSFRPYEIVSLLIERR